jgi:dTDP-3-amino-3,4,6-trideoxy-alpha-D-glucose transaminase
VTQQAVRAGVPFMDLGRHHAPLKAEILEAFDRLLSASAFILGEEVELFETAFAEYCGARHCVGVNSGTAALTIIMLASGVGPGDEVIVPAHTFIATALSVIHAGATPVCADVEPATGLLDAAAVAAAIGPRTAAILPVHLYGQICAMDELRALAARHGLALFEDAAQAHGASYGGARAGSFGQAAAFSFYPSKNLGALGDGGAIVTNDGELAARARKLRDLGRLDGPDHQLAGFNERLDALQAAALRIKLDHLDGWNAARRELAARYEEQLDGSVELLQERPESQAVYHLFPIRTPDRDALARRLAAEGIASGIHYPLALPDQPALPQLRGADAPVARDWASRELSLPIFPELAASELESVTDAVRQAVREPRA